jgi:hypothetical protein
MQPIDEHVFQGSEFLSRVAGNGPQDASNVLGEGCFSLGHYGFYHLSDTFWIAYPKACQDNRVSAVEIMLYAPGEGRVFMTLFMRPLVPVSLARDTPWSGQLVFLTQFFENL